MTREDLLSPEHPKALSFRDPAGAVFKLDDRLLRTVSGTHLPVLRAFLDSKTAHELIDSERLITTEFLSRSDLPWNEFKLDEQDIVVEHDRVWFPSYPYEWPVEMLATAGQLTLEIAQSSLDEGFGLKDATPYNVLFRGTKPVFVDVLSFERRTPGDSTWLPYAQFERMFLLPLLMNERFGAQPGGVFLEHRDGIEPEEVYRHTTWGQRLRPSLLASVAIPTWLAKRATRSGTTLYKLKQVDPEKAAFILRAQFRRLARRLQKVAPARRNNSAWSSYMQTLSYSDAEFRKKSETVESWMSELKPRTVLDIGCNTGHFSAIAARSGARVVGIDTDPAVVGTTYMRAAQEQLDILPLSVDIARPTPAVGWRNAEYPSFLERASGSFEAVTMLAVIHHLMVTERVPLDEIFALTADLTTRYAMVEYVAKDDPMFVRLTRGREALHADFTQEVFERLCSQHFTIMRKQPLKEHLRYLYLLQKRTA